MTNTASAKAPPQYPKQSAGLYANISVYWFALSFLWSGMITIFMQRMVLDIVGSAQKDLYLGWSLAIGAFISTVVVIIFGAISDRSRRRMGRRRPYIILGTLFAIPGLLWLSQVTTIGALLAAFCVVQFCVNIATSPYQALVPDMVPKERQGMASGYLGMSTLLGQLCGFVAYTRLGDQPGGLLLTMAVVSAALALGMFYTSVTVREKSAAENPAPRLGLIAAVVESFRVNPRAYPDFMRLIASRFVINLGFYTATEFLMYYVHDTLRAPHPGATTGTILICVTIAGVVGNFPAGALADRTSKKRVVYVSTSVTCAAALIFLLTSNIPTAMAASCVFGAGFGAFMAVDWAFATNLLPDHDEAKYMGIWHVAFTVPQILAPATGGLVAYLFNVVLPARVAWAHKLGPGFGYRATLLLVIVYLAVGTLMIRPIREREIPKPAR
jgi:MFS family permease